MEWPAEGWQYRTQQKVAFAGCLAAALSLRSNPLRTGSKLREFAHKLVGYSGAAILFSGAQETCRAVRGRHDFLNTALSGAVTGGVVVGHYQGPKYRLLGVVTWGSLCGLLSLANSLLRPRYLLEDYLIREGLLSPIVTSLREDQPARSSEVGLIFPHLEHREVLLESLEVKDREMRQLNERLAAAAATTSRTAAAPGSRSAAATYGRDEVDDIADDDAGYLAWLQSSGFEAEVLLLPHQQLAAGRSSSDGGSGIATSVEGSSGSGAGGSSVPHVGGEGGGAIEDGAAATGKRRSWSNWLSSWIWRRQRDSAVSNSKKEHLGND